MKKRVSPSRPRRITHGQDLQPAVKPSNRKGSVGAGLPPVGDGTRPGQVEMADPQASGVPSGPSPEAIAARAYALFLKRGGTHGDDRADWLQAEAELRAEQNPTAKHSIP